MIGKILTGSALTLIISGRKDPFVISRDHKIFEQLLKAVTSNNEKEVRRLVDVAETVQVFTHGKVKIKNGQVFIGDEVVHNVVADRILELLGSGLKFTFMANFLENLMLNPSFRSRQELYPFMEKGNLTITEDGRFLAFKWVRNDYKDCHSGRFDNSAGQILKMDRGAVDDDRNRTCSNGFHVCTHDYTKFGTRLMVVAVNPKDVVSVPSDYNDSKMRVCEYEVLYEISPDSYTKMEGGFVNLNRDGNDNHLKQKRASNGRFIKSTKKGK